MLAEIIVGVFLILFAAFVYFAVIRPYNGQLASKNLHSDTGTTDMEELIERRTDIRFAHLPLNIHHSSSVHDD